MASLGLAPEELKQLDLLRNRFLQLTNSLVSLQGNIFATQPLPSRESLQNSASILLQNVNSIQEISNENADLFQRIAVHSSTNFPGRTQEHILLQLLRKKLEPDVEKWVEESRDAALAAGIDAGKLGGSKSGGRGGGYGDDDDDDYGIDADADVPTDPFNEQWADIRDACYDGIKQYIETQAREPYTVAEQEMGTRNVRTGLRRSLEEESDEDDEDEDDEDEGMAGISKGAPIPGQGGPSGGARGKTGGLQREQAARFSNRTQPKLPRNVDLSSRRKAKATTKRPGPAR